MHAGKDKWHYLCKEINRAAEKACYITLIHPTISHEFLPRHSCSPSLNHPCKLCVHLHRYLHLLPKKGNNMRSEIHSYDTAIHLKLKSGYAQNLRIMIARIMAHELIAKVVTYIHSVFCLQPQKPGSWLLHSLHPLDYIRWCIIYWTVTTQVKPVLQVFPNILGALIPSKQSLGFKSLLHTILFCPHFSKSVQCLLLKISTDVAAKNLSDQNWHSEGHLTLELTAHDHCNRKSLIRGITFQV